MEAPEAPEEAGWWRGAVSTFQSAKSARPAARTVSWAALVASLTTFRDPALTPYLCTDRDAEGKKHADRCYGKRPPLDPGPCPLCGSETSAKLGTACWSPASYPPDVNRAASRVIAVSALVLDYDDGTPMRDAHERWADHPHIMHTSWSHAKAHPKYRIVLPLLRPVPASGWPRVFQWAMARDPRIDKQCSDASRIFFVPSHPEGAEGAWAGAWVGPGRMLDLDPATLPKTPQEVARDAPRPVAPPVRYGAGMSKAAMDRAVSDRIKSDEGLRRLIAERLGAVIAEGAAPRADKIQCPQCGRPSVFFFLIPGPLSGAQCSHRNSCGWSGWIDQLLNGAEI